MTLLQCGLLVITGDDGLIPAANALIFNRNCGDSETIIANVVATAEVARIAPIIITTL